MSFNIASALSPQTDMYNYRLLSQKTDNNEKAPEQNSAGGSTQNEEKAENKRLGEACKTCASRKYQDGSNDPGVSFKSPTSIKPESAGAAVMAHEQEHVSREKQRAGQEGREVVSQSVTLHMGICPECKKPFVSGGTTRTTTAAVKSAYQNTAQKTPAPEVDKTV